MSTLAHGTRSRPAQGARLAPLPRSAPFALRGVLWIVVFAALLAGVVAVNVAVLQLNVALDRATREQSQLRADIASLRSQLSSVSATARVETRARRELGLVPADPDAVTYVELEP
ncbi:MAG: cell division protein FtsL [Thermoleophilia bacterium]|nr:cell division protein FtsL [Gaiellaceae bacterium]MDW8338495.1 cell division protein FtsL [Thermoleophilia bacterium]